MSELDYEAATLATREQMLWVAVASLVVSAVVGGLQCFLIWRGLVIMRRAADARDRAHENQRRESDQRHAEAMKAGAERHAENMAALREQTATLTAQTAALKEQTATVREQRATLAGATGALRAQSRALEALVERTAPGDRRMTGRSPAAGLRGAVRGRIDGSRLPGNRGPSVDETGKDRPRSRRPKSAAGAIA